MKDNAYVEVINGRFEENTSSFAGCISICDNSHIKIKKSKILKHGSHGISGHSALSLNVIFSHKLISNN